MDQEYWNERYNTGKTGWDIGTISPPLKAYIDQLEHKELRILIPGCGFGHEGRYLWKKGFYQTQLLDFSQHPKSFILNMNPNCFPEENWIIKDFFEHTGEYDLILEQTLFCAIHPENRNEYARKAAMLLRPGGKLVGVLFNRHFEGGPPFGGNRKEYEECFKPFFKRVNMEVCYNSIEPRSGSELFIQLEK